LANAIDIKSVSGLTQDAAEKRLKADGPNELPSAKPRSIFVIAARSYPRTDVSPARGGWHHLHSVGRPAEGLLLLGFVFVVIGITLIKNARQRTRSRH